MRGSRSAGSPSGDASQDGNNPCCPSFGASRHLLPAQRGEAFAAADRRRALDLVPVSRETERRLTIFVDLLRRWQSVVNLVAPATLPHIWTRHVADSAQLVSLTPAAIRWVDLGSGAGFPGLVIALQLVDVPDAHVHLIESDRRKCAFLREVIRETGAPASVLSQRIETAVHAVPQHVDVVCARALAPLPKLLAYARILLRNGAVGVFPKGRDVGKELTDESVLRSVGLELVPSRTDSAARIAVVRWSGARGD